MQGPRLRGTFCLRPFGTSCQAMMSAPGTAVSGIEIPLRTPLGDLVHAMTGVEGSCSQAVADFRYGVEAAGCDGASRHGDSDSVVDGARRAPPLSGRRLFVVVYVLHAGAPPRGRGRVQ